MVRSYWKGALAVMVVCGGLAWSQIPSNQTGAKERIMTVHEDGKSLRCRIINTWQLADGSTAYQVQSLETGEMITLVQEGPSGVSQAARSGKKLNMRIFHWGQRNTPPSGAPMGPSVTPAAGQVVSTPSAPRPVVPLLGAKKSNAAACPDCTERIITWEDKPSQPVVSSNNAGGAGGASSRNGQPTIVASNQGGSSSTMPVIVNQQPRVASSGSAPQPIYQARPANTSATTVQTQGQSLPQEGEVIWEKRCDPVTKKEGSQMVQAPGKPLPQASQVLWEKYTDPVTGKEVYTVPPKTEPQSQQPAAQQPRKFGDRVFQPKQPDPRPLPEPKVAQPKPLPKYQPFTTAAPANPPSSSRPNPAPLNIGEPSLPPVPGSSNSPGRNERPWIDSRPEPVKNERPWRDMWGKTAEPKVQQPGQSLVDPSPIKMPPASTTEKKKNDILMDPARINGIENKSQPKDNALPPVPAAQAGQALPAANSLSTLPPQSSAKPGAFNPQTVSVPNPQIPGTWPLGSQSVLAAKNGNMNGTTFVPVPIATVPNPARLPSPPEPKLPDPPAPNTWVNAFTPPPKQQQEQQTMQNTIGQTMGGQPGMQQRPAPPMMAMGNQRQPLNYMVNYQGPGAPNPFGQQPQPQGMPVQYQQPMALPMPVQPVQGGFPTYVNPAMGQQMPMSAQANDAANLQQLVSVLRESPYPAQREWAANSLATYDWRVHPQVVQVLIGAARQDPAATVRAGCVYSLSRMNAQLEPVTTTLQTLRQDSDPRVRQEVEQALARFGVK